MDEVDIFEGLETKPERKSIKEAMAELVPPRPPPVAQIVPAQDDVERLKEQRLARMKSIEDDIFGRCATIMQDALAFRDIDPQMTEPPAEWLQEMSPEEARKRFRVAQMATLSRKEAPVAIELASKMLAGIVKARSMDKQGPRVLNMTFVNMEGVVPNYKEVKVE